MNAPRLLRVGIAMVVLVFMSTACSFAQVVTTLVALSSKMGASPQGALVQGTDGNFYGTSEFDGVNGGGTVFRVTASGAVKVLHSFCALANCEDGTYPLSKLVQAKDGNFYGTTSQGGPSGTGTVFKVTRSGKLTTLHSFCAHPCADGEFPGPALVQGKDGNIYGEAVNGGAFDGACGTYGCGTLFRLTTAGAYQTIYTFCAQPNDNCTDGELPNGGLIQTSDGSFYGTTASDGNSDTCPNGCGTIFKVTSEGALTTLYTFCSQPSCADGAVPESGVIEGNDGNFYGTTNQGGIPFCGPFGLGCGTSFKFSSKGKFTTLHTFDGTDGAEVWAGLVQGTDGNFYGTANQGGVNNNCFGTCGTLYEMSASGSVHPVYNFCSQANCADGNNPLAAMVQGTDGKFYGVTTQGGVSSFACTFGCGTIYSLNVGLGPFVKTQPNFGPPKTRVVILGNNLLGATSVKFNNVSANFRVVSNSKTTTNVPKGATTGFVTVDLPGGTLQSNVAFLVTN